MANAHGKPVWYELGTSDIDAALDFYGRVLGWTAFDPGMEGFDYRLAQADGDNVAGVMSLVSQEGSPPPNWVSYFAVIDCDKAAADVASAGGRVLKEPADIPRTGRFAILSDPQGAVFGILQPEDMDENCETSQGGAFDQSKVAHGNWQELMTTDPAAAFTFYSDLLGWQKGEAIDMGAMGTYQLFSHAGADIGGMMGLGNAPMPVWLPYFGANGVTEAMAHITSGGGTVIHGPQEVPGGAFIAIATDPQGAHFAVVGPKETSQ